MTPDRENGVTRTEFIDLLDAYWNAAYHEGEAAATTDTPDGRAGKINSALMRDYDALAARLAAAEALLREAQNYVIDVSDHPGAGHPYKQAANDCWQRIDAFLTPDSATSREAGTP